MAKTRNTQTKQVKKKPVKSPPSNPEDATESEKKFDFGGLPERNLKKNLGC